MPPPSVSAIPTPRSRRSRLLRSAIPLSRAPRAGRVLRRIRHRAQRTAPRPPLRASRRIRPWRCNPAAPPNCCSPAAARPAAFSIYWPESCLWFEHDLIRKPVSSFRDHALGAGELRRQISAKRHRPNVVKLAVEAGPDLAAHVGPALAEGEVLAQVSAVFGDHAFEQRKAFVACGRGIERVIALVLQMRILRAHFFQCLAADHEEAGAGIAHLDEACLGNDRVGVFNLKYIL